MKCNEILELMPDLAAGVDVSTLEVDQHLGSCAGCTAKLNEFRQTMALLDEWQSPEPSPYFDTRLQARLREEMARQPAGWWQWIRRPAMAGALALVVAVGITVIERGGGSGHTTIADKDPITVVATPGTAVGDLSALDKNDDVYANFDELDDLQVQPDVTANP
jgi:hypothetical protein